VLGTLRGKRVAFLARHGAGQRILPSELNFRANIYGFKVLGVERLLSASAVGSLKHEYRRSTSSFPTSSSIGRRGGSARFFGRGLVAHVAFAHPLCADLSTIAGRLGAAGGATVHRGGTYVNMEGPQFSTLAESKLYRSWGHGRHRMTNLQEAKLGSRGRDLLRDAGAR
jgi:5'-methylthioadenosine phosphorylase